MIEGTLAVEGFSIIPFDAHLILISALGRGIEMKQRVFHMKNGNAKMSSSISLLVSHVN